MKIFTDGCCLGNPGPGGWAFMVMDNEQMYGSRIHSGASPNTTNNRMELTAVIEAVKYAIKNASGPVTIYSDSKYVVDTIRNRWYKTWKDNRPNWDLWSQLIALIETSSVPIVFEYIVGHSGYNVLVDKAAKEKAYEIQRQG